jgi:hypothetical protein
MRDKVKPERHQVQVGATMRRLFSLVVAVLLPTPLFAAPSCDSVISALGASTKTANLRIDATGKLTAGASKITLNWTVGSLRPATDVPIYFVIATSTVVRFEGLGFLALSKDASNPINIEFGKQLTRAIIPLHNPVAPLNGSLSVKLIHAEPIKISWALVAGTQCGEYTIAKGSSASFSVSPGAPKIVIQNPYDLEAPARIFLSNNGKYRLHIFPERFRVFDVATGALVIEAQGRNPNFSPSSRFLAAFTAGQDRQSFDVFDMETGEIIAGGIGPALIWQNGDSFLVSGADRYEQVEVIQTLVDSRPEPKREKSSDNDDDKCDASFNNCHPPTALLADNWRCNGCGASWSEVKIATSVDSGITIKWTKDGENPNQWQKQLYSLGIVLTDEAPDADSIRSRRVDSPTLRKLEALSPARPSATLADGPTSHAPDARWTVNATNGERDHKSRQLNGAKELRSRLRMHSSIAPQISTVPQRPINRASPVLLDELSDFGLPLASSQMLANEVKSVRYENTGSDDILSVSELARNLSTIFRSLVQTSKPSTLIDQRTGCRTSDLYDQHLDEKQKIVLLAGCAHGLWSFSRGTTNYVIVQTLYRYGTHHESVFSMTWLAIASPNKDIQVLRLTDHFLPGEMTRYESRDTGFPWPGNIHKVSVADKRYLLFASSGDGRAHVFDLNTLLRIGEDTELTDPDVFQSVHLSQDARHVVQLNLDGRIVVSRLADGMSILTGRTTDDELLLSI